MEIKGTERIDSIRMNIELLAYDLDHTNCVPMLRKRWLAEALASYVQTALLKFIEGQQEHGGDFEDVAGAHEAIKENVDAFFYLRKITHPLPNDPTNSIIP
jgi:hypothetical protein